MEYLGQTISFLYNGGTKGASVRTVKVEVARQTKADKREFVIGRCSVSNNEYRTFYLDKMTNVAIVA